MYNYQSMGFPKGGIYVMRAERIYLLAVCHEIGVNGIGPHKHNDWLSFEICVDENPVIIDPGNYCYTADLKMRHLFRSTAYHNTVVIDGKEQIPIHNVKFNLIEPYGEIKVLRWEPKFFCDLLEAKHTGYTRSEDPVTHRRTFHLNKMKSEINITDSFQGQGKHLAEFNFHLDVGITCDQRDGSLILKKNGLPLILMSNEHCEFHPEIHEGLVSKAYNKKESAWIVSWKTHIITDEHPTITHLFRVL
jgi:uncharacterized heparinase superfamily protein